MTGSFPASWDEDSVEVGAYLRGAARRWGALATGALVGLAGGLVLVLHAAPSYTSTTSILVADAPVTLPDEASASPKRFTLDTEVQRVMSAPVVADIVGATGDADPKRHLRITAVPNTKILRIGYVAASPETAVRGSRAAADAYLAARGRLLLDRRDGRQQVLRREVAALTNDLDHVLTTTDLVPRSELRAQRRSLAQQLVVRRAELLGLLDTDLAPGQVVEPPSPRPPHGRPNPSVPPVSGLVLGLAGGLAAGRWRRVQRWSEREVAAVLPGVPLVRLGRARTRQPWEPLVARLLASATTSRRYTIASVGDERFPLCDVVTERLATELRRALGRERVLSLNWQSRRWDGQGPRGEGHASRPVNGVPRPARPPFVEESTGCTTLVCADSFLDARTPHAAPPADGVVLVLGRRDPVPALAEAASACAKSRIEISGVVITAPPGRWRRVARHRVPRGARA